MTSNSYPDASKAMVDGFCSNSQGSSRRCLIVNPSSLKLFCRMETNTNTNLVLLYHRSIHSERMSRPLNIAGIHDIGFFGHAIFKQLSFLHL